MELASRLDEFGKPAWIAVLVAGFWLYWPVGLAVLGFLIWSGRMRSWRIARRGRWYNNASSQPADGPWGRFGCGGGGSSSGRAAPSGNKAFDDYREQTLKRLEDEQREFVEYLERLRQARDKAEFDQFMAERRNGGTTITSTDPHPAQ